MSSSSQVASLTSTEVLTIKQGSLKIHPKLGTAFLLPLRTEQAVQCAEAMLEWESPTGSKMRLDVNAYNSHVVFEGRGTGGISISYCSLEQPDNKDDMTFVSVVPFVNSVQQERARGEKEGERTSQLHRGAVTDAPLSDKDHEPLQEKRVTGLRYATSAEQSELQDNYYMSAQGRLHWGASAAETDGRVDEDGDWFVALQELLEREEQHRVWDLANDYVRHSSIGVLDSYRKGSKGAEVDADRAKLRKAYKAAGVLMSNYYLLGLNMSEIQEQQPEEYVSMRESIAQGMPEVEKDLPVWLLKAIDIQAAMEALKPLKPKPKPKPKPEDKPEGGRGGSSSGRGGRGRKSSEVDGGGSSSNASNKKQRAGGRGLQTPVEVAADHERELNKLREQIVEKDKELAELRHRYEIDHVRWSAAFDKAKAVAMTAKGALSGVQAFKEMARTLGIPNAPFNVLKRPFNSDSRSSRKATATAADGHRPPGQFVFAEQSSS